MSNTDIGNPNSSVIYSPLLSSAYKILLRLVIYQETVLKQFVLCTKKDVLRLGYYIWFHH